ncbi:MAG: squalene/phytoene synthase family protein [Alphaproteobacteria bacterium]|nr:hypothetical protein [Alphaproteobacteria bacterium]MBQ7286084.1 squalene/phytoene synthase family protein [Alphaproteobacteria bacterium]
MTKTISKNMNQENFPVANLVGKKLRPIVCAYYAVARLADDIADSSRLSKNEKLLQLAQIERDFFDGLNNKTFSGGVKDAHKLGCIFAQEKLDASLYGDLLKAFEKDADNEPIAVWEQLIDYCRLSAAPVGRFILALYDESPSTYLPTETLCAVLQISNHLQDMRRDAVLLKRCYLPQDLMNKYDIRFGDIYLDKSSPALKALIAEITDKLYRMLRDASVLPALVKNKRLKIQIGIILSLTNSMLKRIEKTDVLVEHVQLNTWDWIKSLIAGTIKGLMRKTGKAGNIL